MRTLNALSPFEKGDHRGIESLGILNDFLNKSNKESPLFPLLGFGFAQPPKGDIC